MYKTNQLTEHLKVYLMVVEVVQGAEVGGGVDVEEAGAIGSF